MAYCIMRVEKRKRSALYGLQIEANRTATDHERGRDFAASDINWELTPFNLFLVKAENWGKAVTAALEEANVQERKNSVVVLDGFYGASPEWFLDKKLDEVVDYFKDCLAFHEKTYGKVINAVIHFDEATPHLTCQSLPIIEKENGQASLSAREIMGGRNDYRRRQDLFYEQVGRPRGLERGESHDPEQTKKHLTVQAFKNQQLEFENKQLRKESQKLQNQCKQLLLQNQKLEAVNQSLSEHSQQSFMQYCMEYFVKNAKVRGANGQTKNISDGFQAYVQQYYQELRTNWERLNNPQYEEERFREHEYQQQPEIDDREH